MATLFLRNRDRSTLVDIEIICNADGVVSDLHSIVIIDNYSRFLINNLEREKYLISQIDSLSELRGWLFETYFQVKNNLLTLQAIQKAIKTNYIDFVREFSLCWVTD